MRTNVIAKISVKHRDLDYLKQLRKENTPSQRVETGLDWNSLLERARNRRITTTKSPAFLTHNARQGNILSQQNQK